MLDTFTVPCDAGDFNTTAGDRPDPGEFLTEARMKNLAERFAKTAERHNAPARQSVPRRTRRAPPPASPFRLNLYVTAFNPFTATRYGPDQARLPASRGTMMEAVQGDCS